MVKMVATCQTVCCLDLNQNTIFMAIICPGNAATFFCDRYMSNNCHWTKKLSWPGDIRKTLECRTRFSPTPFTWPWVMTEVVLVTLVVNQEMIFALSSHGSPRCLTIVKLRGKGFW